MHVTQAPEPRIALSRLLRQPLFHRRAKPVPAWQHEATLTPAEYPRNRPQVFDLLRRLARRRAAADVELGDFRDRRRGAEIRQKLRRFVDQRPVRRERQRGKLVHRGVIIRHCVVAACRGQQARLHRRGDQRFQIAPAELGVRILAGDDFTLLSNANRAVHAPRGLR